MSTLIFAYYIAYAPLMKYVRKEYFPKIDLDTSSVICIFIEELLRCLQILNFKMIYV